MPDDRLIHRRSGRSRKVSSLSDFEFRVWMQYELSADDFGVMLRSAAKLQSDNAALEKRPAKLIEKAIDRLIEIGLLEPFEHQGDRHVCQLDWQDWQRVKHARHTVMPCPPADVLAKCSAKTQALFTEQHNRKTSAEVPQDSSNSSATFPPLACAGARETANGKRLEANGERQTAGAVAPFRKPRSMGAMGSSPLQHANHARCNDRGVCMPPGLYAEILGRLGNDAAKFEKFYAQVLETMPDDYVPTGTVFKFWHDMLERAYPDLTPTKPSPRAAAMNQEW